MFFYKLIVLLIYAIQQQTTTALKCYSCGEENKFLMGSEYRRPLPCEEMEKSNNLNKYVIECPNNYLGCITQLRGKEIMRTCDTLQIDDCKTANGIKYCYCSQDLCNYSIIKMPMPRNDARKSSRDILNNYPSDDEDYDDDENDDQNDDDDDNNRNSSGMGHLNGNDDIDDLNSAADDDDDDDNENSHDFNENIRHKEVEVVLSRNNSSRNMILLNISFIHKFLIVLILFIEIFIFS